MARFILSKAKLIEQYRKLKQLGSVSYSLKTNPEVGKVLEQETDCFFSVHTKEELHVIKDKSRVWYLAFCWTAKEIDELIKKGVNKFVVCCKPDVTILLEYLNNNNATIDLLVRMKLQENTIQTGKHFVFGIDAKTVNEIIPTLKLHTRKIGVHVHRKTQNISEWSLKEELSELLTKKTLQQIDIINLGGGLPILYRNSSDQNIENIFNKIKEVKAWSHKTIIIEPGRFLSGPPITLEAEIKGVFDNTIVLDCSVYNTAVDTVLCSPIRLLIDGEEEKGQTYLVKGSTPCSLDIMRYAVKLNNPKVGDKIRFQNAGAYNYTTNFCSLQTVPTIIVD